MNNNFLFSVEEIYLINIFDTSDKNNLLTALWDSLPDIDDPELRDVFNSTIKKLQKISDEDFANIGLYTADETGV